MCYLYENNKLIRTNIKTNIVSNNKLLCIFNDLSQHSSSNQYAIQIYSKSYNYSTSQTQFTLYNQPYIYKLSSNVFSDSNTTGSLLTNATNLISNQLFNCNIIDNNNNNKHYISSGHVNINNIGYCPIYGSLIKPSSDLLFYISIGSYFNSSLIPFTITNGIPCLSCTYFYGSGICSSNPCPSSSYQVFYTQIIDYSGYNYTNNSSSYTFSMYSNECPSLLFSLDLQSLTVQAMTYIKQKGLPMPIIKDRIHGLKIFAAMCSALPRKYKYKWVQDCFCISYLYIFVFFL